MFFIFKHHVLCILLASTASIIAFTSIYKNWKDDDLYIYATNGTSVIDDFENSNFKNDKKYECALTSVNQWLGCSVTEITSPTINQEQKNTTKGNIQKIKESKNVSQSLKKEHSLFKIRVDRSFSQKPLNNKLIDKEISAPIKIKPKSTAKHTKSKNAHFTSIFSTTKEHYFGETMFWIGKSKNTKSINVNCAAADCSSSLIYNLNSKHQAPSKNKNNHRVDVWSYDLTSRASSITKDKYYLITLNDAHQKHSEKTKKEIDLIKQNFEQIRDVFVHKKDNEWSKVLVFDPQNKQQKETNSQWIFF